MKYDENSDEELSESELIKLLKQEMGLNIDEVEIHLYLLDKNGNGSVSFDEFKSWYQSHENLRFVRDGTRFALVKSAIEMFKRYDVDGSFSLDREELKAVIREFNGNPALVDSAMEQLDTDHNGKVSFQEFLTWLNWIP